MDTSHRSIDLENIKLIDPERDALFKYDPSKDREAKLAQPWRSDKTHYKHIRISALALLKMVTHAREGGSIEVMGLMSGTVAGDTFIVTDAYRLPVEGTETRVNAYEDAYEYMTEFPRLSKAAGRLEDAVGWYHSHPGYGCWLSGIDVATQQSWQTQDPFVAVVIDPDRTIAGGQVEIGAFRTYRNAVEIAAAPSASASTSPALQSGNAGDAGTLSGKSKTATTGKTSASSGTASGAVGQSNVSSADPASASVAVDKSGLSSDKAKDLGLHADQYYALSVTHFRSTLDTAILEALGKRYWTKTLGSSTTNTDTTSTSTSTGQRDAITRQIQGLASGLAQIADTSGATPRPDPFLGIAGMGPGGGAGPMSSLQQSTPGPAGTGRHSGAAGVKAASRPPGKYLDAAAPMERDTALQNVVGAAERIRAQQEALDIARRVQARVFGSFVEAGDGDDGNRGAGDGEVVGRTGEREDGLAANSHVSPGAGGVTDQLQELQVQMQT